MRRMYSEQELTNVIKEVFEAELASGALDENVSDAVDAYLLEHPVDITALEGQDVELNSLDASGLITGGQIVEKMSGYSAVVGEDSVDNFTPIYVSAAKNGNKLTFVVFGSFNYVESVNNPTLINFTIPSEVGNKLYPYSIGGTTRLAQQIVPCFKSLVDYDNVIVSIIKPNATHVTIDLQNATTLTPETTYLIRIEQTFLLNDSLISE